jgi:hypothetical protein
MGRPADYEWRPLGLDTDPVPGDPASIGQESNHLVQALDQAEVPYKQLNQTVILPSGSNLTAQQQQAIQNYHTAVNKAQNELDAAKALLAKATTLRDNSASH